MQHESTPEPTASALQLAYRNATATLRSVNRVKANRDRLAAIKLENGCTDCGYRGHSAALDFDHLPGLEKSAESLSRMCYYAWEAIEAEIANCEVVCSNCHRIRTWLRNRQRRQEDAKARAERAIPPVRTSPFNSQLSSVQAEQIMCRFLLEGVSREQLAKDYQVTFQTIHNTLLGKRWKRVRPDMRPAILEKLAEMRWARASWRTEANRLRSQAVWEAKR